MAARYRDQVEFLLIYIREAHPTDGWQLPVNERQGALLESAKTIEQKEDHALVCSRKLDIRFTTLVDGMDNQVELNYAGWPDRLYLISREGKIVYKSAQGPAGFKPAELEAAIQALLRTAKR